MSAGRRLWLAVGASTAVAVTALLVTAPPHPHGRLPGWAAPASGLLGGLLLYAAVTRSRPLSPPRRPVAAIAGTYAIVGVLAADEEVLWRHVVLGELLRGGPAAAVAGSSLVFALAHRARPWLHLVTGTTFACLYLASGALAVCVVAHWTYNGLLISLAARTRGAA